MVKPTRRQAVALGLLAAVLAGIVLVTKPWEAGIGDAGVAGPGAARAADAAGGAVPVIGLDRLRARSAPATAGRRDVFQFGEEPAPAGGRVAQAAPQPMPTMPVVTMPPAPPPSQPPPTLMPPANVKYVGSFEAQGVRVAFLVMDRQEILLGQTGDVVANRFKIVKIGFESIDIQDLGSDRVRRIPYKGN